MGRKLGPEKTNSDIILLEVSYFENEIGNNLPQKVSSLV